MEEKKKSTIAWILTFAGSHKNLYTISVATAVMGVIFGVIPYFIMGDMIHRLVDGDRNWQGYLMEGILMALCWAGFLPQHLNHLFP